LQPLFLDANRANRRRTRTPQGHKRGHTSGSRWNGVAASVTCAPPRVVKHYATRAGLDPASFAGHSMRSGYPAWREDWRPPRLTMYLGILTSRSACQWHADERCPRVRLQATV
jgi:hypothetical protein